MPTFVLRSRAPHLTERMSDPACDLEQLNNTYRHFDLVNRLVAGWRGVYERYILPHRPRTLLDIGCGGGDVARRLAAWAERDGLELAITAADPDERALAFARSRPSPPTLTFEAAYASDLVKAGRTYDVVISNHLLHHLGPEEIRGLCRDSARLAAKYVVHNDIRRSDLAYLGFALTRPFFGDSFITFDGLRSIRRSFTRQELAALVPDTWRVEAASPFRNLLRYDARARQRGDG